MPHYFKNSIIVLTLLMLVFAPINYSYPGSGHRETTSDYTIPVPDTPTTITVIRNPNLNQANGQVIVEDLVQLFKQVIWDTLWELIKVKVLDMLVNQIVGFVQGQTKGGGLSASGPKFIQNWQGLIGGAGQQGIDIVLSELDKATGGLLCTPFAGVLKSYLRLPQLSLKFTTSFPYQVTCSLDKVVGNIQNFYDDFNNGGWNGYAALLQPNNNFYGVAAITENFEERMAQSRSDAAADQGIASKGYLGTAKCSGGSIGSGDFSGVCLNWEITTPGDTLAESVAKGIGSRIDYIVNSQDWGALAAVIIDGFISKLIDSGDEGLLGFKGAELMPDIGSLGGLLTMPVFSWGGVAEVVDFHFKTL